MDEQSVQKDTNEESTKKHLFATHVNGESACGEGESRGRISRFICEASPESSSSANYGTRTAKYHRW